MAAPTLTSFSPYAAKIGDTITYTGSGFTGTTTVTVNGTAATVKTVVSDTILTFVVPVGATTGIIAVTNASGTTNSATTLTVTTPVISSFTPSSGFSCTITGTNFLGTEAVLVGGQPVQSFTVVSATSITFLVSSADVTGVITVITSSGNAVSSGTFTVVQDVRTVITPYLLTRGVANDVTTSVAVAIDATNGMKVVYKSQDFVTLLIKNTGSTLNLTIRCSQSKFAYMRGQGDYVVSIASGATVLIPNLEQMRFKQYDGNLYLDFDSGFTGTIAAILQPNL
jgi:hypothetical protein